MILAIQKVGLRLAIACFLSAILFGASSMAYSSSAVALEQFALLLGAALFLSAPYIIIDKSNKLKHRLDEVGNIFVAGFYALAQIIVLFLGFEESKSIFNSLESSNILYGIVGVAVFLFAYSFSILVHIASVSCSIYRVSKWSLVSQ